ncbi:MAG: glutamate formimidoyltransferase [Chloroflexi bacterium]|nr:glutamate formimidoyltransferase [Chloroflexota bacterium]
MALVECVPNFSEGRRADVIAALVAAVEAASVHLLDVSSDRDHNRTVITFVGEPEPVIEAAYRTAQVAAAQIDLTTHRGVHPRIGAVDVIPLIPLREVALAECVGLARRLGQRIGTELGIPVYLYEAAATRAERTNLAVIRRGGYEALQTSIESDATRQPDFGPARVGSAGAVAVGARGPLIAFNVYLETPDVTIAQAIARTIRAASDGLPAVKALGVLVGGQAQVSVNLTDFRQTSLHTLITAIRTAAQQRGVEIARSELVGLVPQAALIEAALDALMLPPQAHDQVLEYRVGAATQDYRPVPFE